MSVTSLPAQIFAAINAEDASALRQLFTENPSALNAHTFMAGQTWLGYAAQKGKLAAIRALSDLGADVNVGDKHDGAKPICSAASSGNSSAVRLLLELGAQLDIDASVRNPLFSAIVGRSPETVRILLEARIDARIRYNSTTMKDMDAVAFALLRGEQESAEVIARWNAGGDEAATLVALQEADKTAENNARA